MTDLIFFNEPQLASHRIQTYYPNILFFGYKSFHPSIEFEYILLSVRTTQEKIQYE